MQIGYSLAVLQASARVCFTETIEMCMRRKSWKYMISISKCYISIDTYGTDSGAIMTTADCWEPGICPLLKITQNLNPKNREKFKPINVLKQKVVIAALRYSDFKKASISCLLCSFISS